jgi:hypothetical protein
MKQDIKIKLTKSDIEDYDRSVYMSEYVTLPRDQVRMMRIREVIAWGIAVFFMLVTFLK